MADNSVMHSLYIGEKLNGALNSVGLPAIPDHILMSFVVTGILVTLGVVTRRNLRYIPSGIQNVMETAFEFLEGLLISMIGPKGPRYFPVIATLALFILTGNLLGLVPFMGSPTANINVTLGCAMFIFCYYHIQGVKEQGWKSYLKHFTGPSIYLAPLFFPLEIISHFSRVMSLSIRLCGNIMGEDIIIIILFIMSPWFLPIPVPMMMFAIFTCCLQTFIFIMLSMVYIAGAVADEGH